MEITTFWWISLAIALVIALVVALLLILIVLAANRIDRHAQDIWEAGKKIAANTVSIWMLGTTNDVAKGILDTAGGIADGAGSIDRRLAGLAEALRGKGG